MLKNTLTNEPKTILDLSTAYKIFKTNLTIVILFYDGRPFFIMTYLKQFLILLIVALLMQHSPTVCFDCMCAATLNSNILQHHNTHLAGVNCAVFVLMHLEATVCLLMTGQIFKHS